MFKVEARSLGSICRDHGSDDAPAASLEGWLGVMHSEGWEFVAVVSDSLYVFRSTGPKKPSK